MIEIKLSIDEVNLLLAALDVVVKTNGIKTNPTIFALNAKIIEIVSKSPDVIAMNSANVRQNEVNNIKESNKKPGPKKKKKMINANDLLECAIRPALKMLASYNSKMNSEAAEHLLLGTAAVESKMGYHLKQEGGPALGIYQIEPETHASIIHHFVLRRSVLAHIIDQMRAPFVKSVNEHNIITNLIYASAICRIKYWPIDQSIPHKDDLDGLASYWKTHYNTWKGKGTMQKFIDAYNSYVRGNI